MKNFCEQCGAKLWEGAAFCSKCGASTGVRTPNKGKAVSEFAFSGTAQQAGNVKPVQEKKKGKKAVITASVAAIVLILAVAGVVLYLRSDGYQCRENMNLAEENFEAEEYKKALSYYKKALALDNTLVEAYVKSADIYVMEDSFEDAQKILKRGLKKIEDKESLNTLNDKLEEVYQLEEDFYSNAGDYEQATAEIKEGPAGVEDVDVLDNRLATELKEDSNGALSGSFLRKTIKVGIINNDPNESVYRTANDADLKKTFTAENGYDASFAYSNNNDEQITATQKFIRDGVDYLLLSAADTAGWDSTLQDAEAAGIKVILFDRVIDVDKRLYEASIVSDMAAEGRQAVDWLKSQRLSEYKIIHLQGTMGSSGQKGRSGALNDAVLSEGWTLVTQQTAGWNADNAQQIVQSVIDSGESFNVI